MLAASARRIRVDDSRRAGSAPGPVIARDRPEVAGLGLAAPGIEHRHWRLVDGEFGGGQEIGLEPLVQRHQLRGRIADPEGERRAIKLDALGGQHFGLAIQRQMPAVFRHQHRGDHGFGRQAGFDQMLRRRRFHDLLARPAGERGPVCNDHPILGRDHVEPLGSLFADHMHRLLATRAVRVGRRNRLVNAWQMGRQRATVDPPFPRRHFGGLPLLLVRLCLGDRLLEVLQRQIKLIGMKFGEPAALIEGLDWMRVRARRARCGDCRARPTDRTQ